MGLPGHHCWKLEGGTSGSVAATHQLVAHRQLLVTNHLREHFVRPRVAASVDLPKLARSDQDHETAWEYTSA
jgi:hypothetical protein